MSNRVRGVRTEGPADWREHYRAGLISVQDAARLVKPGMRVHFPLAAGSIVQRALAARSGELAGPVNVRLTSPLIDPGWFASELGRAFQFEFELFIGNLARPAHDALRGSYLPNLFSTAFKALEERPDEAKPIDLTFVNVTPPNDRGFVSFGPHQWNKREYIRHAGMAVAEVDKTLTRPHGDVWIHVRVFDYFVEATPPTPDPGV